MDQPLPAALRWAQPQTLLPTPRRTHRELGKVDDDPQTGRASNGVSYHLPPSEGNPGLGLPDPQPGNRRRVKQARPCSTGEARGVPPTGQAILAEPARGRKGAPRTGSLNTHRHQAPNLEAPLSPSPPGRRHPLVSLHKGSPAVGPHDNKQPGKHSQRCGVACHNTHLAWTLLVLGERSPPRPEASGNQPQAPPSASESSISRCSGNPRRTTNGARKALEINRHWDHSPHGRPGPACWA